MALFHHVHEEDPSAEAEQSFKPVTSPDHKSTASRKVMLRQMLINSTAAAGGFDMMTQTHTSPTLNVSQGPVSVSAFLKPTGRSGALREGELNKPDLTTYIVMCLVLFLMVLLIVFFINCQLRNSFFASMPYDRSLREARSSYK